MLFSSYAPNVPAFLVFIGLYIGILCGFYWYGIIM